MRLLRWQRAMLHQPATRQCQQSSQKWGVRICISNKRQVMLTPAEQATSLSTQRGFPLSYPRPGGVTMVNIVHMLMWHSTFYFIKLSRLSLSYHKIFGDLVLNFSAPNIKLRPFCDSFVKIRFLSWSFRSILHCESLQNLFKVCIWMNIL